MKKPKFIINLYNRLFTKSVEGDKRRRLEQDSETGELNWGEGEKPFDEDPEDFKKEVKVFHLNDSNNLRTAHLKVPSFVGMEPLFKNRFYIEFPGIPGTYFNAYKYIGHDINSQKLLSSSKRVIQDDYSAFRVILTVGGEIDICDKLVNLEENPKIGDIKINILDPTGFTIKTILIPNCEVTEIKAFRDLSYGGFAEKTDAILYGEIVVKHKQRKLI